MRKPVFLALGLVCTSATAAAAQTDAQRVAELEAKIAVMAQQMEAMQAGLAKLEAASDTNQKVQTEVIAATQTAQRAEQAANEWKNITSVSHISGYAAAGYTDQQHGTQGFNLANFNPIFHFQYGDRILWESELEIEVPEGGGTNVALEYSAIDVVINDNLVFVGGKFLSPLGYFRQNLHPTWINKMPTPPPGFGHDGAAPSADVGFQLRGGAAFGAQSRVTYSTYVGNGPILVAENGELVGIESEGLTDNPDNKLVTGARVSVLPFAQLEIGFSGAYGDATVTESDGVSLDADPKRNYSVLGSDLSYEWHNFQLLAEYIQQKIDDESGSVAPDGGKAKSWYAQGAYRFGKADWLGVVRYADFNALDATESQKQWSVGVDYLLAPSAMIKLAYDFNDGMNGEPSDDDAWMVQITYGY